MCIKLGNYKMNEQAREIIHPEFNFYKPKEYHPDWKKLNIEATHLALNIAKNSQLKSKHLQGTLLQKRKILAIMKTVKNLLINKQKMARGDHDFIPIFYIWTMTNNCNFLCTYCSNHRGI